MTAMPSADASRGERGTNRDAVELDRAFVVGVRAAEDLDQGRLAGAVLAGEHMDLAAEALEVDVDEHRHGAEPLADPAHAQEGSERVRRRVDRGRAPAPAVACHCISRR